MNSSRRTEIPVDPLEWLRTVSAPATDPLPGSEAVAGVEAPRLVAGVGGADPAWAFAGEDHANLVLEGVGDVCKNHCPIAQACVEGACRFYRLEEAAENYLEGDTEWLLSPSY